MEDVCKAGVGADDEVVGNVKAVWAETLQRLGRGAAGEGGKLSCALVLFHTQASWAPYTARDEQAERDGPLALVSAQVRRRPVRNLTPIQF
jgi:hypothetical protein